MQQPTAHVPAPEMIVDDEGTPRATDFDDVYFSARHGVAETEHVYLAGNSLPERWQERVHFTIGELGFGTGLNFLVAWKKFMETNHTGTLHFVSIEKFPLTLAQLTLALAHQPTLAPYAQKLIASYPLRLPGLHRIQFDRVTLTIGFGDVAALLPEIDAQVDAWFLDGFAPAKNEAMWSAPVFQQIARLCAADATFATFTAAGVAKRGLQEVGFMVQKVQGFGHKRDMLVGMRHGEAGEVKKVTSAIVVGGGIAGCMVARALAERGLPVTLLEKNTIASAASGNPAAVLYPQLTKYYTPATQWHLTGYAFMLRALKRWHFPVTATGMLKIGKDEEDDARLRSIRDSLQLDGSIARWLEPKEASAMLGQPLTRGGFFFPDSIALAPAELCRMLMQHPNITAREHQAATSLSELDADVVVIANAQAANDLLEKKLAMGTTAGQVTRLRTDTKLNAVLCHKGYAIATAEGMIIGATYDREDLSGDVTQANHQRNIDELHQALPVDATVIDGRTSFRATTPSRLPHVGAVADGVYVSVGHGSRGMISAALAAEIIASQAMNEPLPVSRALLRALAPRPA